MIRNRLHILMSALLALASCSGQDSLPHESSIGFDVMAEGYVATKVTDTSFEGPDVLNVLGFLVKDGGQTDYTASYMGDYASTGISPFSFTYSGVVVERGDGSKVYATGYSWPAFARNEYESLDFYAYYAVNKTTSGGTTGPVMQFNSESAPTFSYLSDVAGQAEVEDFLFVRNVANKNDVKLTFKRPLAKVVLKLVLKDWISAEDFTWMFDDFEVGDVYDCVSGDWISSDQTLAKSQMLINTMSNEVAFYALPQTVEEFAFIWNYHKELITLSQPLELTSGNRYTITLTVTKDKVIGIQTSDGVRQWDTVINDNIL